MSWPMAALINAHINTNIYELFSIHLDFAGVDNGNNTTLQITDILARILLESFAQN